jgi:hypothetical protein
MREQRDIGAWVFSREIRLGADNKVRAFEVVECAEDLWSIEPRVQRYQYRPNLEERIRKLCLLAPYSTFRTSPSHTVANSALFPSDTATRSPFLTPDFWSPRAKRFESRSSAS